MPATTSRLRDAVPEARRCHPHCWVCAPGREDGLAIEYRTLDDGAVEGTFDCPATFEGYPGLLHGGVVSTLLDGSMTHCLMARGKPSLTARLEVRYLKPVRLGRPVTITGWLVRSRGTLHDLGAALNQNGEVVASARGRFMELADTETAGNRGGPA